MSNPRLGDNVWVEGLQQCNGKIIYIDYHGEKEVIVESYDTHEQTVIEWRQFTRFNERLNQWLIYKHQQ